jgi:hypothetical protein
MEDPSIAKGVAFLRGAAARLAPGEAALAGLALVKAEVPGNDPGLAACLASVFATFPDGVTYTPQRSGGPEIYEAACIALLLSNLDPVTYKPQIQAVASYLVGKQLGNGGWDYSHRSAGDTSISQYGVLGLWEAENSGAVVHPSTWDKSARWFMSTQRDDGGWEYHPDEANGDGETVSMTAAGAGSLLICMRQLARYRKPPDSQSQYLIPIAVEGGPIRYDPQVSEASIRSAVSKATNWLARGFVVDNDKLMGQSTFYGLYGVERFGALAERDTLGSTRWFEAGAKYITTHQQGGGNWQEQHGEVPNTSWCVLFLTKSTAKSIKRIEIKRLGAGTLVGGRGLPTDLSSLTVAGGRVLVRPMNGAIEGMLSVLEDPRAMNADSALAGLVERYQKEGPKLLRPHRDRFRRLLTDRDPGIRRVAAWGLGHMADLDVTPALIGALEDEDEGVVAEARIGLQILSRKIDGYGPSNGATPDEKKEAAKKWRAWYDDARPPDRIESAADSGAPRPGGLAR